MIKIKYKTLDGLEAVEDGGIHPPANTIRRRANATEVRTYRFHNVETDGAHVYLEAKEDRASDTIPSPGSKLYGQACAREQVARDLLDRAKRAWQLAEMMSPDEIRDFAIGLRKLAEAERENGKELYRIAQESDQ